MAGRPRKPTALKVLHGDFEVHPERENTREPKPRKGEPTRPKHLGPIAREAWKRLAAELRACRVLTKADREGLELYAINYELWRRAVEDLTTNGLTYEVEGRRMRNPAAAAANDHAKICIKLLTEFGLTPSSRTRVQIEQENDTAQDKASKFNIG